MELKPRDYRVRLVKSGKMIEWFQRLKPEELKNENRIKEVENNIEFISMYMIYIGSNFQV